MLKRIPQEVKKLAALPEVKLGELAERISKSVKGFLDRFGYLGQGESVARKDRAPSKQLDESTSIALVKYQAMHGLPLSGEFDRATREMMARRRCGFPDINPSSGLAFSTTCAWGQDALTYAFSADTADVTAADARAAVRRAFATWSAAVQIAFREVATTENPDIQISWTQANCGDTDMTGGVLAHADYPPGCGFYGNALPRPLHFDDQENTWCIGAVASQFDIETTALHEIGHLLGLSHSTVAGAIMFPTVGANSTNTVLTADDIEGIRRLYPIRGPIFARHIGRCIDIEAISTANGADAIQWDYWGGWNQLFRVEWVEASHYRLIAQHSGRVIDVDAYSSANGAQIHQWDWWGGDNQKFRLEPMGHGYYRITPKHSGKSLDVSNHSGNNGAKIIQWDWWGGWNQQWRLGPAPIISRHSGRALDVEAISIVNGARMIQWDYWGGANQRFRLDPVEDGYYRIMIENSGKCLDVYGLSTANGAQVIQWEYWGGDNQKFRPEPTGDGFYRLVAKHSGKCVDVSGVSVDNGAPIIQWDWWGGANQQWRL